jgi:hypothetical protein
LIIEKQYKPKKCHILLKGITMTKMTTTILSALILFSIPGFASSVADVKSAMKIAREALTASLEKKANDEGTLKKIQETGDAATVAIDGLKAPAGKEAALADLKKNWQEFKTNRDGKLKDFIKAGKFDDAKTLATGRQKELLDKINAALDKLGGGGI